MEEIIKMMNEYAKRHKIKTPSLLIEIDKTGELCNNPFIFGHKEFKTYFTFNSIDELKQKLKE